ncbi:MAG: hypothetical protein AB7O04_08070 [Hyphomonadaceae bacterium]
MSEPNLPPPPQAPPPETEAGLYAKRRLPFETTSATPGGRHPGLMAGAVIYAIAAIAAFVLAGYMALVARHPLVSVPVIAPIAGGIWFIIRTIMVLRPNAHRN